MARRDRRITADRVNWQLVEQLVAGRVAYNMAFTEYIVLRHRTTGQLGPGCDLVEFLAVFTPPYLRSRGWSECPAGWFHPVGAEEAQELPVEAAVLIDGAIVRLQTLVTRATQGKRVSPDLAVRLTAAGLIPSETAAGWVVNFDLQRRAPAPWTSRSFADLEALHAALVELPPRPAAPVIEGEAA